MKLYKVDYMDDCDDESYLTIGNSKKEVEEREIKNYLLNVLASWDAGYLR